MEKSNQKAAPFFASGNPYSLKSLKILVKYVASIYTAGILSFENKLDLEHEIVKGILN